MVTSFEFSDNVVGILLEEKLDADSLEEIQKDLKKRIKNHKDISLFLEDKNREGISLQAFLKELLFEFSHPEAFRKIAIVTDNKVFKILTEIKNVFVKTKVEVFGGKERIKAMNWMME